mgnify:CR=1 FL=1
MQGPPLPKSMEMNYKGCMMAINRTSVLIIGLFALNGKDAFKKRVVQYNFELDSWTVHSFYPSDFSLLDEVACSQTSDKTNQK